MKWQKPFTASQRVQLQLGNFNFLQRTLRLLFRLASC